MLLNDKRKEFTKKIEKNDDFLLISERFPRISQNILLFAGHNDFSEYMNKLMMDSRDGGRLGFPPEIYSSLFKLSVYHDEFFHGRSMQPSKTVYEYGNRRDIWRNER